MFGFRLSVARHDQAAAVRRREINVHHFDRSQFLQHGFGRQTRGVDGQAGLQCHRQAVRQERNEDVRVHAILELVVDRPNRQVALEALENGFNFETVVSLQS